MIKKSIIIASALLASSALAQSPGDYKSTGIPITSSTIVTSTIATLRKIVPPVSPIYVQNLATNNDGGNGWFNYSGRSCTDNTGVTIKTGSGNCYTRQFSGPVDVRWFGVISGSVVDQAPIINSAIAYVNNIGGGTVLVPAGNYSLLSQIVIKNRVILHCANNGMTFGDSTSTPFYPGGAIFNVKWGSGVGSSGNVALAAIVLKSVSTIDGCGFNYPSQVYTATTPIEYGATILAYDIDNVTVPQNTGQTAINNFCYNCYSFLDFRGSLAAAGIINARVEYNWGSPVSLGLRLNYVVDWGHFNHNIFHAGANSLGASFSTSLAGWTLANGEAFELGNSDWVNLDDEQEWGYALGVNIIYNGTYYTSKGPIWISHSQFDSCMIACINDAPLTTDVGILHLKVTHNTFTAFNSITGGQSSSSGIVLNISSLSPINSVNFSDNFIFGPTNYIILGSGTDMLIANNVSSPINGSSTIAAAGPAFTLAAGTTNIMTNNTMVGFGSIFTSGAYTNVVNTGNFIH